MCSQTCGTTTIVVSYFHHRVVQRFQGNRSRYLNVKKSCILGNGAKKPREHQSSHLNVSCLIPRRILLLLVVNSCVMLLFSSVSFPNDPKPAGCSQTVLKNNTVKELLKMRRQVGDGTGFLPTLFTHCFGYEGRCLDLSSLSTRKSLVCKWCEGSATWGCLPETNSTNRRHIPPTWCFRGNVPNEEILPLTGVLICRDFWRRQIASMFLLQDMFLLAHNNNNNNNNSKCLRRLMSKGLYFTGK